jgi:hypothetical protein
MDKIKRFLLVFLTVTLFVKMFVMDGNVPWQQKFELFSVPAQSMRYGDFRNVQTAVYCQRQGFGIYGANACNAQSLPARAVYPDAHVPVLNYPPVWARLYAWFDDGSERYFLLWGRLNAGLLLAAIIWLTYRRDALLAPLLLFSPPVLLCVERGNIDGMTFAVLFVGVSLSARHPFWRGLVLMAAAGMKLFPALAVGAWLDGRSFDRRFALGLLLGSLMLIEPLTVLTAMLGGTAGGFYHAFGLWCFQYVPFLRTHPVAHYALLALIVAAMAGVAHQGGLRWGREAGFIREVRAMGGSDISLCLASLIVFVGCYLLFFNWAYRIIFLLPALIVLSRLEQVWVRGFCLLALLVLWSPVFSVLWRYFDVGATLLAIMACGVGVALWLARRSLPPASSTRG